MKAMFIAAGFGSRLKPIIGDLPKPLADINGKSLLERQIVLLKSHGINRVIVIVGPNKEKFTLTGIEYVNDLHFSEHEQLGSLMEAKSDIFGELIILFADIIFDDAVLKDIISLKADIAVAIDLDWKKSYKERKDNPESDADKIAIKDGRIVKAFKNDSKLDSDNIIGEFIGLMKLSKRGSEIFVKKYEECEKNHFGPFHNSPSFKMAKIIDMLQELIDSNINIEPCLIKGKWCEVDTPLDLLRARRIFK